MSSFRFDSSGPCLDYSVSSFLIPARAQRANPQGLYETEASGLIAPPAIGRRCKSWWSSRRAVSQVPLTVPLRPLRPLRLKPQTHRRSDHKSPAAQKHQSQSSQDAPATPGDRLSQRWTVAPRPPRLTRVSHKHTHSPPSTPLLRAQRESRRCDWIIDWPHVCNFFFLSSFLKAFSHLAIS